MSFKIMEIRQGRCTYRDRHTPSSPPPPSLPLTSTQRTTNIFIIQSYCGITARQTKQNIAPQKYFSQ